MLVVTNLSVNYGAIRALHQVSCQVNQGEVVALIGANGAGKTTILNSISGIVPSAGGSVSFEGEDITRMPAHLIVRKGICQVPEGRRVFARMSVQENLEMGGFTLTSKSDIAQGIERAFALFPRLAERRKQAARTLSGGEQQMLAMGRALMLRPEILLLDEPSMGLAPKLVEEVFRIIRLLKAEQVTMLLVEQFAMAALGVADHAYVLENGRIRFQGPAQQMRNDPAVRAAYLGGGH